MPKIGSIDEALLTLSEGITSSARKPNIKRYKPHEKQFEFHSSPKKKKLYMGGNRSGKTTGGVCEDIWRATCRHPYRTDLNEIGPNRGRVVAVSFTEGVEKIIFPQFQQWLYPSALKGGAWEVAYNKTLRTLTFANGSTIEFMSYDQDLDKFAGTSRHWVHFDEEPPKSIYIECMARLIDTDGDFYITMTPVEGMTWVYDELYEPWHNDPNHDEILVIEINTYQNPYLSQSAISSFMNSIDQDEITSRIGGQFVAVGGRIYKQFDPTVGGLHVLKDPIDDPKDTFKNSLIICSLDHGVNNPTAVYWTAWDKYGKGITFEEYYQRERSVKENATEIRKINRSIGREPDLYVADPSIKNRNGVTLTSIHEEYVKYGIPFTLGNNDVKGGLVRFRGYLNPNPRFDDKPAWQITPNCAKAIWELKKYRYKVFQQKKLRDENNPYEEPQKKDDHACDSLRYMIMTRPDLRNTDLDFAAQIDDVVQNLGVSDPSITYDMADPHDLKHNTTGWTTENTIPNRYDDDWQYDEHMGGVL